MAAYVFAETQLTQAPLAGPWMVTWLFSFIAPQDRAVQAMQTILHSTCTFEIGQKWDTAQLRAAGDMEDWTYRRHEEQEARARARIQEHCAQFQSQVDTFSKALRGSDFATETVDGEQREVWGNGGSQWIHPVGVDATSPLPPGLSSHPQHTEPQMDFCCPWYNVARLDHLGQKVRIRQFDGAVGSKNVRVSCLF